MCNLVIRQTLEKVYIDKAITDQLVEEIYRPSCDPGAAEVFAQCLAPLAKNRSAETVNMPLLMLWGG